jgi:hypothetical protein
VLLQGRAIQVWRQVWCRRGIECCREYAITITGDMMLVRIV